MTLIQSIIRNAIQRGQDIRNLILHVALNIIYGLAVFIEDGLIWNDENKNMQGKQKLILSYNLMQ